MILEFGRPYLGVLKRHLAFSDHLRLECPQRTVAIPCRTAAPAALQQLSPPVCANTLACGAV
eukprot:5342574-Prymnesium_polylepis.1